MFNLRICIDTTNIPNEIEYGETIGKVNATLTGRVLFGNLKQISVEDNNKNDFSKVGKYISTYKASFLFYKAEKSIEITVVDKKAPVITLTYIDDHYTLPNEEYIEEGFSAYDEYDGDLTDKVTFEVKDGKVIYTVTDSSGNIGTATREIKYKDTVPPEIQLNGDAEITISKGEEYKENGATATDNCDGEITDKITIEGIVDTTTVGVYTVRYTVTDNSGNTSFVERKITVKEEKNNENTENKENNKNDNDKPEVNGNGKTIYLTFDDGPCSYTEQLLAVLEKYNVKATFFVVGNSKAKAEYMKKIVEGGHAIGIHSVTHEYEDIYVSEEAFLKDLYNMQNIIKENTGVTTYLMRFPGGSSNSVSKKYCEGIMTVLTKKVEELGFQYFDWNISSGDAGGGSTTKEQVFNAVIAGVKKYDNSVVLQHDIKKYSVDAVEDIIKWGLENGYTFKALDMDSPTAHHSVRN